MLRRNLQRNVSWLRSVRHLNYAGAKPTSDFVKKSIETVSALTQPKDVYVLDGTKEEEKALLEELISLKTIEKLNPEIRPDSYLARSDPKDVARVEKQTYICTETKDEAGPLNNWQDPTTMKKDLNNLFTGSMSNRTMYVIPFSMGPVGSDKAKYGIQYTDSAYVALSMRTMARVGTDVLDIIEKDNSGVIMGYHTVGAPLKDGEKDVPWPCNTTKKIVHFPQSEEIWSFGSGYGGNALLGKKCLALRIASYLGQKEGWLAEHMLIVAVTNPKGEKFHIAAAFPSACGKTNLAMLEATIPGWKVTTIGDDIAWMKFGEDGRLYAINPENGFFGVAPGTSNDSNLNAMKTMEHNAIFTNVAKTPEGDVWWEGMTKDAPPSLIDWKGNDWTPASKEKAAHPNSRFTVAASQCPVIDPAWNDPKGVAIDAILFGGRRATTVPLLTESFDWNHGTLMGASVASEQTAAAEGTVGALRRDPFAMLPFVGYNMADYWKHWINQGKGRDTSKLPSIFQVNWFRKDKAGKFIWPGFGENSRVLKWVCERRGDTANKMIKKTPIGYLPKEGTLDLEGLDVSDASMKELFEINSEEYQNDLTDFRNYIKQFGDRVPKEIVEQVEIMEEGLKKD